MRILILTEYFPDSLEPIFTGGVESRVYHLVKFLEKKHKVEVVARTANYSFNSLITIIHRALFFLSQLFKITLCNKKYDIVEGTNFTTHILAFLYAKRTGAKAVAWYPDVFIGRAVERLGFVSGIVAELAERITARLSWDGVIALSGETKKKLINAGLKPKKIETIYGGVQLNSEFEFRNSELQKFRKPTVICIARLVKYKRVGDLLLAVYFLRERFKDIRVIIVGDGPMLRKLKIKNEKLKISGMVKFLSKVSEEKKRDLLARAHIHVLPSVVEGFGLATVEALAAGVPVVNADIPINREVLQKRGRIGSLSGLQRSEGRIRSFSVSGGLLFKPGDAVDLAEKIELLLTDKEFYNQKVKEGMELVKRYEWEKVNRQTEGFYQRLLSD